MEFDERLPIYQQVQIYYKQQIASGKLEPGTELPSRREIAKEFKINPNTVQRALKELEEEALIITEPNVPSKVTQDKDKIQAVRRLLLQDAIHSFHQAIAPLKLDEEIIIEALRTYINQEGGEAND